MILSLTKWVSVCLLTGRAIKHVKESIFTSEAGARRGVPKVLVVLTDGRSQDDVNKVSKEMQMDGWCFMFRLNTEFSLLLVLKNQKLITYLQCIYVQFITCW